MLFIFELYKNYTTEDLKSILIINLYIIIDKDSKSYTNFRGILMRYQASVRALLRLNNKITP